jgi:uncharacterized protein (TIRG00374 family)
MAPRMIGSRMVTSVVVQYAVYMVALVVCGFGLWAGLFAGHGPAGVTLGPALFAVAVILLVLSVAALPFDPACTQLGKRLVAAGQRVSRPERALRWSLTAGSTVRTGIRSALALLTVRRADRRSLGILGALAYWGFDIAVLWCSFRAFGAPPPVAVVIMSYFVGTLAALLPLPGGIGGVEGGMIGVLIAFGVPAGQSVVAVLAYRAISFWLPTLPGIAGYLGLRRTVRGWELARAEPAHAAAWSPAPFADRVREHRPQRRVEAKPDEAAVGCQ